MRQHYYAYNRYLILGYSIRHIFLKHLLRFLTSVFTLPATTVFAIATTLQSDRVPAAFCDYSAWSQLATYLESLAHANTCGLLGNPMPQGFPSDCQRAKWCNLEEQWSYLPGKLGSMDWKKLSDKFRSFFSNRLFGSTVFHSLVQRCTMWVSSCTCQMIGSVHTWLFMKQIKRYTVIGSYVNVHLPSTLVILTSFPFYANFLSFSLSPAWVCTF